MIIFFLHLFYCLLLLLFFSHCSQSLIYINLLYLPLWNFAYLFFLSFLLNIFISFIFTTLFPNWHLALVLFSSLYFTQFCSGRYNFWFPLFAGSIYCTLILLDCFLLIGVYIYMCIFSHTFYCYKPLPLCWAFLKFCGVFLFPSIFFFSFFYNFN